MYIVDRNQAERANHSRFEEAILSNQSSQRALLVLLPLAAVSAGLLAWSLVSGISPLALGVAFIFLLALFAGGSCKRQ